jgi:hypothetical protein
MFDFLFNHIRVSCLDPVADLGLHVAGDTNAAGLSQGFQPGRGVDPFAVHVTAVIDNISHIYSHEEFERAGFEIFLQGYGAGRRIQHRREFDKKVVTGGLDDAHVPDFNVGFDHVIPHRFPSRHRAVSVLIDKLGKTRQDGGKGCREPALILCFGLKFPLSRCLEAFQMKAGLPQ